MVLQKYLITQNELRKQFPTYKEIKEAVLEVNQKGIIGVRINWYDEKGKLLSKDELAQQLREKIQSPIICSLAFMQTFQKIVDCFDKYYTCTFYKLYDKVRLVSELQKFYNYLNEEGTTVEWNTENSIKVINNKTKEEFIIEGWISAISSGKPDFTWQKLSTKNTKKHLLEFPKGIAYFKKSILTGIALEKYIEKQKEQNINKPKKPVREIRNIIEFSPLKKEQYQAGDLFIKRNKQKSVCILSRSYDIEDNPLYCMVDLSNGDGLDEYYKNELQEIQKKYRFYGRNLKLKIINE